MLTGEDPGGHWPSKSIPIRSWSSPNLELISVQQFSRTAHVIDSVYTSSRTAYTGPYIHQYIYMYVCLAFPCGVNSGQLQFLESTLKGVFNYSFNLTDILTNISMRFCLNVDASELQNFKWCWSNMCLAHEGLCSAFNGLFQSK